MNTFVATEGKKDRSRGCSVTTFDGRVFAENRWREAILHFLNLVQSGRFERDSTKPVGSCTKAINFNGMTLELSEDKKQYFAYGDFDTSQIGLNTCRRKQKGDLFLVDNSQYAVEAGLIRLVRCDTIAALQIKLPVFNGGHSWLLLQKMERRSSYAVSSEGVLKYFQPWML